MTDDGERPLRRWDALSLTLPARDADEIGGLVAPITTGLECVGLPSGATRMRVFLNAEETDAQAEAPQRFVEDVLRNYGLDPEQCDVRLETVEDGRWVERYQAGLRPIPIGSRFTVLPSAQGAPEQGRLGIQLVPGRAFGTGEHPTTQLCATQLEQRVQPDSRWLDVGCGTAILTIVAKHCGAGHVVALDNDPDATAVSNEVLQGNGMTTGVEVVCGTIDELPAEAFDGVVANISASFFFEFSGSLVSRLRPGGVLVATGFIHEHAADVEAALEAAGLRITESNAQGEWALRIAERS